MYITGQIYQGVWASIREYQVLWSLKTFYESRFTDKQTSRNFRETRLNLRHTSCDFRESRLTDKQTSREFHESRLTDKHTSRGFRESPLAHKLKTRDFRENSLTDNHISHKGVHEFLPLVVTHFCRTEWRHILEISTQSYWTTLSFVKIGTFKTD
jgi:hypothetical protein